MKLTKAFIIETTKTNRKTKVLHSFYSLKDGSAIAFFEDPSTTFLNSKSKEILIFILHLKLHIKDLNYFYDKGKNLVLKLEELLIMVL